MPLRGSHSLPPLNFDPAEHLYVGNRHRNIADIPGPENDNAFLLRWYPNEDSWDYIGSVSEAIARIQLKRRHFDIVSKLGNIAIPEHRDFIGINPIDPHVPEIAIYTLVERVRRIQPLTAQGAPGLRQLHSTLGKYYRWIQDTQEPAFVLDLFKADTYCQRQPTVGIDPAITVLLDVDPYVVETSRETLATARQGLANIHAQIVAES